MLSKLISTTLFTILMVSILHLISVASKNVESFAKQTINTPFEKAQIVYNESSQ